MAQRTVMDKGQRVATPIDLAARVTRDPARTIDNLLREAEAAVAGMSSEFRSLVDGSLTSIKRARDDERFDEIFSISHELRGLAASFDLPLLTEVGSSLCDFVAKCDGPDALCKEVIDLHIASMLQIMAQNMTGNENQTGRQLVEGLQAARAKANHPE